MIVLERLDSMPNEHHIVIDKTVPPVVNPAKRLPIAICNKLREEF